MSLEDKMKFYLDYYDLDKSVWDADYGNMDFFAEKTTENIYMKRYIFPFSALIKRLAIMSGILDGILMVVEKTNP